MKFILVTMIISLTIFIGIFIIEGRVIDKLSDTNRFKIWWRNHMVGVYSRDEDT